jgi:hypothetical protein
MQFGFIVEMELVFTFFYDTNAPFFINLDAVFFL